MKNIEENSLTSDKYNLEQILNVLEEEFCTRSLT
jgi:hypothetical protein